jgi:hypothetical protein
MLVINARHGDCYQFISAHFELQMHTEYHWQDSQVGSSMPQNLTSVAALLDSSIWEFAAATAASIALMPALPRDSP